jgi:hypothetical protein
MVIRQTRLHPVISKNWNYLHPHRSPDLTLQDAVLWGMAMAEAFSDPATRTLEQLRMDVTRVITHVHVATIHVMPSNILERLMNRNEWRMYGACYH